MENDCTNPRKDWESVFDTTNDLNWSDNTYGHFIIFIGFINAVTKEFSEVLIHNFFF